MKHIDPTRLNELSRAKREAEAHPLRRLTIAQTQAEHEALDYIIHVHRVVKDLQRRAGLRHKTSITSHKVS